MLQAVSEQKQKLQKRGMFKRQPKEEQQMKIKAEYFYRKNSFDVRLENWKDAELLLEEGEGFIKNCIYKNTKFEELQTQQFEYRSYLKFKGFFTKLDRKYLLFTDLNKETFLEKDRTALKGTYNFYTAFIKNDKGIWQSVSDRIVTYEYTDFEIISEKRITIEAKKEKEKEIESFRTEKGQFLMFG